MSPFLWVSKSQYQTRPFRGYLIYIPIWYCRAEGRKGEHHETKHRGTITNEDGGFRDIKSWRDARWEWGRHNDNLHNIEQQKHCSLPVALGQWSQLRPRVRLVNSAAGSSGKCVEGGGSHDTWCGIGALKGPQTIDSQPWKGGVCGIPLNTPVGPY